MAKKEFISSTDFVKFVQKKPEVVAFLTEFYDDSEAAHRDFNQAALALNKTRYKALGKKDVVFFFGALPIINMVAHMWSPTEKAMVPLVAESVVLSGFCFAVFSIVAKKMEYLINDGFKKTAPLKRLEKKAHKYTCLNERQKGYVRDNGFVNFYLG